MNPWWIKFSKEPKTLRVDIVWLDEAPTTTEETFYFGPFDDKETARWEAIHMLSEVKDYAVCIT